ncbi:MAG: hypothetical protein IKJ17_03880 [Clostridia bacterium]|nr:hypothetical protein [Clostridia bacterium]
MNTENFNAVNDAQGGVVDTHNTTTDSGVDNGEVAVPRQSVETNAAFASMRRSMQQAQREKNEAIKEMNRIKWQNDNAVSIERDNAETSSLKAQLEAYKSRECQRQFASDLEEIKNEFPNENAKSIEDLGLTFIKLRACGVDNLTAYRAIASQRHLPADIGRVGADASQGERLFSSEELDALSKEQLDNPGVLKLAIKSMRRMR